MNHLTTKLLLLGAQAATTWALTGLIWFVQVVHYPLFAQVGPAQFAAYHRAHADLTSWVVGPAMLVELASGAALLWLVPPGAGRVAAWAGVALLLLIWGSTALVQIPLHQALDARGPVPDLLTRLVATNWVRTLAWTLRAVVCVPLLCRALLTPP